jgi:hypothetical protein
VIWPNGNSNLYLPGHRTTPIYTPKRIFGDEVVCGRCNGTGEKENYNVVEPKTDACGLCGGKGYVIITLTGRILKEEDPILQNLPPGA